MSRRHAAERREILPDAKYGDPVVMKFINSLMRSGMKSISEATVYGAFDRLAERGSKDPLQTFHEALNNVKPALEVRSRRVGGATYQVPVEVKENRRIALSVRWVIQNAKARSGRSMAEKLTGEIVDAYNNAGGSIKKKEDVHRMAEANKAFAHYRW